MANYANFQELLDAETAQRGAEREGLEFVWLSGGCISTGRDITRRARGVKRVARKVREIREENLSAVLESRLGWYLTDSPREGVVGDTAPGLPEPGSKREPMTGIARRMAGTRARVQGILALGYGRGKKLLPALAHKAAFNAAAKAAR